MNLTSPHIMTSTSSSTTAARSSGPARALTIGGGANLAIAAAHAVGLIWAWSMFRAVGIEEDMRLLARDGAALPYLLTLVTAGAFAVFGLYALSGAGVLRRLPLLRTVLVVITVVYLYRATWAIGAIGDGDAAQVAFAAAALLIGGCYAYGLARGRARSTRGHGARNITVAEQR